MAECGCSDPTRAGCTAPQYDYLLIEALQGAALSSKPHIEVSLTPAYGDSRLATATAAIRLPDACLNESAAQVTGDARNTQTIATTQCGVWLAELEKALVGAQFRVVSWDSLKGLERSKNLPAYEAAKALGADVLFLFNSIEAANVLPGGKTGSRMRYFHSNAQGERHEPYPMTDQERAPLRASIEQIMDQLATPIGADKTSTQVSALSATLDATAILTTSGESIWFYRNRTVKPLNAMVGRQFLLVRDGGTWQYTKPEIAELVPLVTAPQTLSAEDSSQTVVGATRDPYAVERLDLMRTVAHDFVDRYRTGKPGEG